MPSSLMSAVVAFLGPYTALLEDSVRAVLSSHIIAGKFLLVLVGMFLKLVKKVREGPCVLSTNTFNGCALKLDAIKRFRTASGCGTFYSST